jgi:hypothetical protein
MNPHENGREIRCHQHTNPVVYAWMPIRPLRLIDGLLYQSSMAGRVCATLWSPALDSFPPGPAFSKLLADPAEEWMKVLRNAAAEIHYDFYR